MRNPKTAVETTEDKIDEFKRVYQWKKDWGNLTLLQLLEAIRERTPSTWGQQLYDTYEARELVDMAIEMVSGAE